MDNFDFDKVAKLSHLEFSETEKQSFIKDMHEMLSLADSLCALDNEDIPEAANKNIIPLAKDETNENSCEGLVLQSKRNDGEFVTVPSTIE